MPRVFANPELVSRSWYPAVRSRALGRDRIRAFTLGRRRVVAYRDAAGRAHAIDARCPHLGADLSRGRVVPEGIRCAMHGWTFADDGRCRHAPGIAPAPERAARVYPVQERWGFVWIFNGPAPAFDLPAPEPGIRWRAVALPSQRIRAHPHLVLGNGLDIAHYEAVHGLALAEPPRLTIGSQFDVTLALRGRPRQALWQALSGTRSRDIVARFTTIGGSLAFAAVLAPIRFDVLFTGRPDPDGHCVTQTIFLFPTRPGGRWLRALAIMAALLHDDRRVLDGIDFRPAFTAADRPLRAYAEVVDALGAW